MNCLSSRWAGTWTYVFAHLPDQCPNHQATPTCLSKFEKTSSFNPKMDILTLFHFCKKVQKVLVLFQCRNKCSKSWKLPRNGTVVLPSALLNTISQQQLLFFPQAHKGSINVVNSRKIALLYSVLIYVTNSCYVKTQSPSPARCLDFQLEFPCLGFMSG